MEIIKSKDGKTITFRDDHCWICRKLFNKNIFLDRRTYHHAIEQRHKPFRNMKLPICQRCHYLINSEDQIYCKKYNMLRGIFLLTEKQIQEFNNKKENGRSKQSEQL